MRRKLQNIVVKLMNDQRLRVSDTALYLYLYSFGKEVSLSYRDIAETLGYTPRTAKSGIERLFEAGYIEKRQKKKHQRYDKNTYIILDIK